VTDYDKVIPPGSEGKVFAAVDISHIKGPVEKAVDLETNDPEMTHTRLVIKANVMAIVDVRPVDTVRFTVNKGQSKSQELTLIPSYEKPVQVSNVTVDTDVFAAELIEPTSASVKPEYKLKVTLSDQATIGTHSGMVKVGLQGAPVQSMEIPVLAVVRGSISVTPTLVSFQLRNFPDEVSPNAVLNLRQQPDATSAVVGKLSAGELLRVIGQKEGWYQVISGERPDRDSTQGKAYQARPPKVGWVSSKLVKTTKQAMFDATQNLSILKSTGNFKILELYSTVPEVKVEVDQPGVQAGRYNLKVTLDHPEQIKKNLPAGSILIRTDDADQPELRIPIYVIVS
jgi:hypothetical protein